MIQIIAFLLIFLWAFSSSAQRMHLFYDSNFNFSIYHSPATDSTNHFQFTFRSNALTGALAADSAILFRSSKWDTASIYLNDRVYFGSASWRNQLYLYSRENDLSGLGNFNMKLFPLTNNFLPLPDSISIGPLSYFGKSYFWGRSKVEQDQFLESTCTASGNYSPRIFVYNFQDQKYKYKLFDSIIQDTFTIMENMSSYLPYPGIFEKNKNYLITFDSLKRNVLARPYFDASTLVELDSNLNPVRTDILRFPFSDTTRNTGLKMVKDVFQLNNRILVVGMINHAIPNTAQTLNLRNEIGVMLLDSNRQVLDTMRIGKPNNMSLMTGYMNSSCWCNGKLFVAATLQTRPSLPSGALDEYQHPQGLLIAKLDTPFNLAWSKRIFIPGRQFRLYDVHCINGKMVLGGLFADSNLRVARGVFSIEVDQDGNYLPLNTNNQEIATSFQPYPNPFSNQLNLPVVEEGIGEFRLYDLNGRLVFTRSNPEYRISLPTLPSGLYIWQAESVFGKIWRGKVVRE